jgi:hypothetical protein
VLIIWWAGSVLNQEQSQASGFGSDPDDLPAGHGFTAANID